MIWLTGIRDESDRVLQQIYRNNCYQSHEWLFKWHQYCKKYLTEYYGDDDFTSLEELIQLSISCEPETTVEKYFVKELTGWMSDYRIAQLQMEDTELSEYLQHGPKNHFYLTSEFDMLRDEGIIFYGRLKDASGRIGNPIRLEHFDCAGAPHAMMGMSTFGGGTVTDFDTYMYKYIDVINEIMSS